MDEFKELNILKSDTERFRGRLKAEGECLVWQGAKHTNGYGLIGINWGNYFTHRLAWMLANQKVVPEGMQVCHTCDNPPCCRPEHLFLGTALDNTRDMIKKNRQGTRSRLTTQQKKDIRTQAAKGESHRLIGLTYDLTRSAITKIVNKV